MKNKKDIVKKAKNIKLLACDVDGILTHGEMIVLNNGEEIKIWNVKDGTGYNQLSKISPKIKTAWITGRQSSQVEKHAKNMSIDYLIQNCINKMVALEKILKESGLKVSETAYIGDDIIDISVLKAARLSVCPMNACEDVKKYVDYVSILNGGEGIVREVIELIMKAKGEWKKSLDRYTC
ncbi:KdsC family phosphatase [Candidatus Endomicrobiellum agilis]|jgi:3-deoxy-D-manno-octulosonate 8-phosphate phosphatase (KDO 8-P phosphatase)|uniref:KdsC family phosphatase n=1 Tax=Candidatus Endomicrobiellum agilis TaxID=3238957 RepID=UPI00284925D7|nr:HAD hydrolase family protein [Endomicrobium sp.]MDR3092384.1 HAD hydrolase family protein [Endomicrobium sp.]